MFNGKVFLPFLAGCFITSVFHVFVLSPKSGKIEQANLGQVQECSYSPKISPEQGPVFSPEKKIESIKENSVNKLQSIQSTPLHAEEEPLDEYIFDRYLVPELEVFQGNEDFHRFYKNFDEDEPIDEWGIEQELNIKNKIPWSTSMSLNYVECKKTACIMYGKSDTKEAFIQLYKEQATEGTFLNFYGNNYEIAPDGYGKFVWIWKNFN